MGSRRPAPPFGLTNPGYITMDAADGIVVARIDGSERHVLVAKDGESISPIWSRDGLHLAFWHRDAAGSPWSLVVVDQDATGRRVLVEDITLREREDSLNQPSNISWSPDSDRMVYAADTPSGSAIFVASRTGGGVTRITDPSLKAIDPAWAPDGSTIVFVSSACTLVLELVAGHAAGELGRERVRFRRLGGLAGLDPS